MYGIKINDVSYNVAYEYPITYTLDKTLDFGSINIPAIPQKTVFPMYSVVEITRDDSTVEYFLTIGDVVKLSSYNPPLYSHSVQLVEYTKKLENYLISAATFTQPTDGTTRYTYYDIIDRLIKISVFETESRLSEALPCSLDSSLLELNTIKAPEFFFYNKTLKQALDEVLASLPAIPRLKRVNNQDVLFIDYLDATSALITEEDIDRLNIKLSYDAEQNVTNYATTMVSDVSNAVRGTKGQESVTVYPNSNGWAPLSTKTGFGVLDNNQSVMDLKQGIYDVVSLEVQVVYNYTITTITNEVPTTVLVRDKFEYFDLSRFIVTKQQYDALQGSWDTYFQDLPVGITQAEMIEQGFLNKQNAIWFEPGTPFIDGLTTNWRSNPFTNESNRRRNLENAILSVLNKNAILDPYAAPIKYIDRLEFGTTNIFEPFTQDSRGWEDVMFRCVFIPQEKSNRVEVERLDLTNFTKQSFAYFKQNANLINLNAYINKMEADLQRVGEEAYVVNAIHKSYDDLLNLGDITADGYVLMSYTVTQHLDYIEVAYNFSRNYQQINERIAVDKSNDYFELVSGDKVVDRFVTYKDYAIISDTNTNITSTTPLITDDGAFNFLATFVPNLPVRMIESFNTIQDDIFKTYAPVAGSGIGSSILLSAGFNNNAVAGYRIIEDVDTGGFIQSPVFYAVDGELEEFDIEFYDQFSAPYFGPFVGFYQDELFLEGNIPNPQTPQYAGVGSNDKETAIAYTGNAGIWVNMQKTVAQYEFDLDLVTARQLPLITRSDYNVYFTNVGKNLGSFKLYKDPGERLKFNYQLQTIVAPDNIGQIIIGNYFNEYNGLVHTPKENLFIHHSDALYGKGDVEKVKINQATPNGFALDASAGAGNIITINNSIPANANSYGVSDSSGKLLFAVNKVDGNLPKSLKFTFSHTRPGLQKL